MNYGHYQEAAAQALRALVATGVPSESVGVTAVLPYREHLHVALGERLTYLGADPTAICTVRSPHTPNIHRFGVHYLARLVADTPRLPPQPTSPSDVLTAKPQEAATRHLQQAARCLMLATDALQRTAYQPWIGDAATGWHLLADAATVTEAVLVLDAQLDRNGALTDAVGPSASRWDPLTRRTIAEQCARVASWAQRDPGADLAVATPPRGVDLGDGSPIAMVHAPEDFALTQRTLARFLRPCQPDFDPAPVAERPGVRAARVLGRGQAQMCELFARYAAGDPGSSALVAEFRTRRDLFQKLHAATARLHDTYPRHDRLLLTQQSEMVTRARALAHQSLDRVGLLAVNAASHQVAVALGTSLRRELYRHDIQQTDDREVNGRNLAISPINNTRHPFYRACKALADAQPPQQPPDQWAAPREREALRRTLDQTPSRVPYHPRRSAPEPRHGPRMGR